jgi:hypothetical protein
MSFSAVCGTAKAVPFQSMRFSAAYEAYRLFCYACGTAKAAPFQSMSFSAVCNAVPFKTLT